MDQLKFKHQATLLNMVPKDEGYEKYVHDYRVKFMLKKSPKSILKKPCIMYVLNRSIEAFEQEKIFQIKAVNPGHMTIESVGLKNNAVCIYSVVNNRNIDLIFHQMYERIEMFKRLNLLSLEQD